MAKTVVNGTVRWLSLALGAIIFATSVGVATANAISQLRMNTAKLQQLEASQARIEAKYTATMEAMSASIRRIEHAILFLAAREEIEICFD